MTRLKFIIERRKKRDKFLMKIKGVFYVRVKNKFPEPWTKGDTDLVTRDLKVFCTKLSGTHLSSFREGVTVIGNCVRQYKGNNK